MTIDSFTTTFFTLAFLIPGFIFFIIYRKFVPAQSTLKESALLSFLLVTCVNYGFWSWLLFAIYQSEFNINHPYWTGAFWLFIIFISPAILGFAWGLINKYQLFDKILNKIGINIIKSIPTSWDYKFNKINDPVWILVTLKDGSYVAGYWGSKSFASSESTERDLYIEEVYTINSTKQWEKTKNDNDGILIQGDQIKTIEFFSN